MNIGLHLDGAPGEIQELVVGGHRLGHGRPRVGISFDGG
jgi:hypothetical protein